MNRVLIFVLLVSFFLGCKTVESKYDNDMVLWAVEWSPNDKLIAIGGNWNEIQLLSANSLEIVEKYKIPNTVTKIKWHPNRELLAVSTQISHQSSILLNIESKQIISLDSISKDGARGLDWNFSGKYLATGDYEGDVNLYTEDGVFIRKIRTSQKAITGLSWHPNRNIIVTVGSHIEIIDIDRGTNKKIIPRDEKILMLCVAWHQSGNFFVTGDYGNLDIGYPALLQFWNSNGDKIRDIEGSKAEYRNLEWSSDGNLLVTASDRIRIWTKNGKLIKTRSLNSFLWGIDWNSENSKIIVTSENGEITMLDKNLKVIVQIRN